MEREAASQKADVYTMQSQAFLEPIAERLLKESDLHQKKGVEARIVPFFDANSFYIFFEQTYTDIRLVVNPPLNVAQFGGNQDNWVWPRHSADFAMFRIYADKDGQPADYSSANVPLRCKKFLPISLQGTEEGDYTMVMGFPGRTSRYLTASSIESRLNNTNRPVVLAGTEQLAFYKQEMDADPEVRISLENDNMMRGNVVKNYGGMIRSVQSRHLVEQKRQEEAEFRQWTRANGRTEFEGIIERLDSLEAATADTLFDSSLLRATLGQQSFYVSAKALNTCVEVLKSGNSTQWYVARKWMLGAYDMHASTANKDVDRRMMRRLIPIWQENARLACSRKLLPAATTDVDSYLENLYEKSAFKDRKSLDAFLDTVKLETFLADPFVAHWMAVQALQMEHMAPAMSRYSAKKVEFSRIYTRGICEMKGWTKAPDANFTLRMTYGHTCDLHPRDAVHFDWRTTLDGLFEKENPNDSDYVVNERLRQLYDSHDFGRYARKDGKLPLCFLSNNDITGGNSGSPVLNAKGELVGLAFDGNIESLSSDLQFDPELQRCINVDIRYVLFVIDKFGGSSYVLNELDVR